MTSYYLSKLIVQLPYLLIFAAALVRIRRMPDWMQFMQVVGAGLAVLWILVDWIFLDRTFGLFMTADGLNRDYATLLLYVRNLLLGLGLPMFALGYLLDAWRYRPLLGLY